MLLSLVLLAGTVAILPYSSQFPLLLQGVLAVGVGFAILALDIPLFNLTPLWGTVRDAMGRRLAARV